MNVTKGVDYILNLKGNLASKAKETELSLGGMKIGAGAAAAGVTAVAAASTAAALAIADMVDEVVEAVDELTTLASATGLATDTVEGLSIIAKMTRKDVGDLIPRNFAKNMEDARNGTGKAADGFKMLGLEQDELREKWSDNDELLLETIRRLTEMEDENLKAAAASEIFGKSGEQMLSAFSDVGDLEEAIALAKVWGYDVSPQGVESTAEWQKTMAEFDIALASTKASLAQLAVTAEPVLRIVAAGVAGLGEAYTSYITTLATTGSATKGFAAGLVDGGEKAYDFYNAANKLREELGQTNTTARESVPVFEEFGPTLEQLGAEADEAAKSVRGLRGELGSWEDTVDFPQLEDEFFAAGLTARSVFEAALVGEGGFRLDATVEPTIQYEPTGLEVGQDHFVNQQMTHEFVGMSDAVMQGMVAGLAPIAVPLQALEAVPRVLDDLTASIESMPETLLSIPDAVIGLVDAIGDLPVELVNSADEILMSTLDAMFSIAMLSLGEVWFTAAGQLLEQLPGKFAQELADVLQNLFTELNPFDGEGGGISIGGKLGAKVEDYLGIDIPLLNTGGHIAGEGLAYLHKDERVLTRNETRTYNQQRTYGDIHIHGDSYRTREQLRQLMSPYGPGRGLLTTGWGM